MVAIKFYLYTTSECVTGCRYGGGTMNIYSRLYNVIRDKATGVTLETLSIGLGYSAVCTDNGGIGVAFTPKGVSSGCQVLKPAEEYEGVPAIEALEQLNAEDDLHRTIGLALVNALNHSFAKDIPEDRDNDVLLDALGIEEGSKVAMVGYFAPIIKLIEQRKGVIEVVDRGKNFGDQGSFEEKLGSWPDAVILTSTSIINNTFDALIRQVAQDVPVAMVGPSTPMVAEAFAGSPVRILAGTVPMEREPTLKAIRHAKGTPMILRFSRKATLQINQP